MQGLLKHPTVPHRIEETEDKGRGVFANAPIKKGKYVCEYKTTQVYKREQRARHEEEYATNMEACMILEAQTKDGWICLDATRRFGTVGRLMNHAAKKSATVKPFKPLKVNGKWRVAFIAARDIEEGEELTWDYGCPPEGQEWLMRCRRTPAHGTQGMPLTHCTRK